MTSESRWDSDKDLGSSDKVMTMQNMSNLCSEQRENLRRCTDNNMWPIGEQDPKQSLGINIHGRNDDTTLEHTFLVVP